MSSALSPAKLQGVFPVSHLKCTHLVSYKRYRYACVLLPDFPKWGLLRGGAQLTGAGDDEHLLSGLQGVSRQLDPSAYG